MSTETMIGRPPGGPEEWIGRPIAYIPTYIDWDM